MENGKYFESCNFSLKFNICQSYESQTLGLAFLQDYPSPTFFFMSCQVIQCCVQDLKSFSDSRMSQYCFMYIFKT